MNASILGTLLLSCLAQAEPPTRIRPTQATGLLGPERRPEPIGPTEEAPSSQQETLWPEGFMLADLSGRLRPSGDKWQFVAGTDGGDDPAVITVLPNSKLELMEAYARYGDDKSNFRIRGLATEYNGENYILVRDVAIEKAEPPQQQSPPMHRSTREALKADTPHARPLTPPEDREAISTIAPAAVAPFGAAGQVWPEGSFQTARTGRLIQEVGWWSFAFESDSDTPPDAPVRLLPNLALEQMVDIASVGGKVFIVSGELTEYHGQNYMLIKRYIVKRPDGNIQ